MAMHNPPYPGEFIQETYMTPKWPYACPKHWVAAPKAGLQCNVTMIFGMRRKGLSWEKLPS